MREKQFFNVVSFSILLFLSRNPLYGQESLVLRIGESKLLSRKITTIALGNPDVLSVQKESVEGMVRLIGKAEGSTIVQYWEGTATPKKISVLVLNKEDFEAAREIRALLRDIEDIHIQVSGEHVRISGEVLSLKDFETVKEVASRYKRVISEVKLSLVAFEIAASKLRTLFAHTDIVPYATQHALILKGEAGSEKEKQNALELARKMVDPVFDEIEILFQASPIVSLQILIAELNRKRVQHLGIDFPDSLKAKFEASLSPSFTAVSWSSNPIDIETFLHLAEKNGAAKIIATPHLSCRSGEAAEFFAGGSIPIETKSRFQHQVSWKPFGISLKIHPKANKRGLVQTQIKAELSNISGSGQLPSFRERKIDTVVNIQSGNTLILGGLLSDEWERGSSAIPILSAIPLIGVLFQDDSHMQNQEELLIAVTPHLLGSEITQAKGVQHFKEEVRNAK